MLGEQRIERILLILLPNLVYAVYVKTTTSRGFGVSQIVYDDKSKVSNVSQSVNDDTTNVLSASQIANDDKLKVLSVSQNKFYYSTVSRRVNDDEEIANRLTVQTYISIDAASSDQASIMIC